ncbi:AAA domain-containing protein [Pavlovales sp. CCMP2436]|nr:AAA domain-containing protein [Pavlovales sp. CCMP2436]
MWAPAVEAVDADTAEAEGWIHFDDSGHLCIGDVRSAAPVTLPARAELVPQIEFHTSRRHAAALREMLADDNARLPLLLLGDQGVGKNKLCDKFLQLLKREREYVQLHRDTTLSSLTQAPSIEDGKIVWKDSALVRAATYGRTLVVDEADKAPLEVVCVLRALVEGDEVMLADGRVLVRAADDGGGAGGAAAPPTPAAAAAAAEGSGVVEARRPVVVHPDFRVIVLANRYAC